MASRTRAARPRLRALAAAVGVLALLVTSVTLTAALTTQPAAAADPAFTLPAGLGELSGFAMSARHPGVVYAHNDSGNTNQVFAIDTTSGQLRATLTVTGTQNTDWEAIAVGRDEQGRPAVFVGDIGNNFGSRPTVQVHRFVEPEVLATGNVQPTSFSLTYPSGAPDAESLLVDPVTGQLYIATKVVGGEGRLFRAPQPLANGTLVDTGRTVLAFATDAGFAPAGTSYAVRSGAIFGQGQNVANVYNAGTGALMAQVPLPAQPQGESMTYLDCATLLVGSEGDSQVWTVPLPDAAIPPGGCDGGPGTTTTSTPSPTSSTTTSTSSTSTSTTSTSTSSTTTSTTVPGSLRVMNPGDQTSELLDPVRLPIRAAGGQGAVACSASGLPRGLWMNSSACEVVGWPFSLRRSAVTVTARDGQGRTASASFGWTVTWG